MANAKCKKDVREDLSGVDFAFSNGEVLLVNISELSETTINQLVNHGISQKVGDSYAGAETVEDAFKSASEMIKRLIAGEWKTVRSSGASKTRTILAEALMRGLEKSFEDVTEMLEDKSNEERTAIGKHPSILPFMEQIKMERAQEKLEKAQAAAAKATSEADPDAPSLADLIS